MKKKKEDNETITEEIDEKELKKKKKKKLIIIISLLIFLVIVVIYIKPFFLITKKNRQNNMENLTYLKSKFGDSVDIRFYSKKRIWKYRICSKTTTFCAEARYKNKKWHYPQGEGFIYTVLFMDEATSILSDNNIEYKTYANNKNILTLPTNFILIIKKDDENKLINAIKQINRSNLIDSLCVNSKEKCNGKFEINIFNNEDYDLITSTLEKSYDVAGYEDFYQILYDKEENRFGKRLGENVVRHGINDDMFTCNDPLCNNYKHLAYRYVVGNHNYVGNTMIVEGIKK